MPSPYVSRLADSVLQELLGDHPAVMVTGPRSCGKTTTASRQARTRFNLADNAQALAMAADPFSALNQIPTPVLIDEWQLVPASLAAVKNAVDSHPERGQFIVTGSVRGDIDSPTWPGTGRLINLPMYGLTEREVEGAVVDANETWLARAITGDIKPTTTTEDIHSYVERALRSGFPEPALHLSERGRYRWLHSYVDHLLTRDVESLGQQRDPARLGQYLRALALNSAGVVDDATLFDAAKIAKNTARAYTQLLQNLLVIDEIPAWTENHMKRLALAPKRFLVDAGLLVGVLDLNASTLRHDGVMLGKVLETFIVSQIRAEAALMLPQPRLYHLRTHKGLQEIDLILEVGNKILAIEIKAASAPRIDAARHLQWFQEQVGDRFIAGLVIHTGPRTFQMDEKIWAVPVASLWS